MVNQTIIDGNYFLVYHFIVVVPVLETERGDKMDIDSFVVSVMASVVAYYICKWLDGDESDN